MNVFGHRERSWRKARKQGVSPIIATILLVAITVVLAAVLYVLISGLTHGTGGTTLGSAFAAGTANPPLVESATATTGCAATHFCYVLTIESAGLGLSASDMNFVIKTATGSTYVTANVGGFTIYNSVQASNVVTAPQAAAGALTATTWTNGASTYCTANPTACTSTTQLASTMIIVIDTGATTSPSGTGLVFSALGVGSYSGTVSVPLP